MFQWEFVAIFCLGLVELLVAFAGWVAMMVDTESMLVGVLVGAVVLICFGHKVGNYGQVWALVYV